jgi:hypothetical protein
MASNTDTWENVITWFTREFDSSRNAATALHNVQVLKNAHALSELDDNDAVANVCKAVSKDVRQSVAKIAATKLKLACSWVRHQYRTSREIGGTQRPLVKIVYRGEIDRLQQQKQEEDQWAAAHTEPEYPLLTLDTSTATKAFDKVRTILGRTRGVTGVLLLYVIRVALVPPEDDDNDPAFGDEDLKYNQHNRHAALAKYDVAPLEESMKIHYFEDGISDPLLATVKTTILVDRTRFKMLTP